jgi:hypothetical protein
MWSTKKIALASVLSFLIVQLNIYFAWTSHVGARGFRGSSPTRLFLVNEVNYVTKIQLAIPGVSSYFSNLVRASSFRSPFLALEMRYFVDYEVITFAIAIFVISFFLFWGRGLGVSMLRAFEIASAAVLPLGIEIYYFDPREFNVHASDIQIRLGLAWFTNSDVLYASLMILTAALFVEFLRYAERKTVRVDPRTILTATPRST